MLDQRYLIEITPEELQTSPFESFSEIQQPLIYDEADLTRAVPYVDGVADLTPFTGLETIAKDTNRGVTIRKNQVRHLYADNSSPDGAEIQPTLIEIFGLEHALNIARTYNQNLNGNVVVMAILQGRGEFLGDEVLSRVLDSTRDLSPNSQGIPVLDAKTSMQFTDVGSGASLELPGSFRTVYKSTVDGFVLAGVGVTDLFLKRLLFRDVQAWNCVKVGMQANTAVSLMAENVVRRMESAYPEQTSTASSKSSSTEASKKVSSGSETTTTKASGSASSSSSNKAKLAELNKLATNPLEAVESNEANRLFAEFIARMAKLKSSISNNLAHANDYYVEVIRELRQLYADIQRKAKHYQDAFAISLRDSLLVEIRTQIKGLLDWDTENTARGAIAEQDPENTAQGAIAELDLENTAQGAIAEQHPWNPPQVAIAEQDPKNAAQVAIAEQAPENVAQVAIAEQNPENAAQCAIAEQDPFARAYLDSMKANIDNEEVWDSLLVAGKVDQSVSQISHKVLVALRDKYPSYLDEARITALGRIVGNPSAADKTEAQQLFALFQEQILIVRGSISADLANAPEQLVATVIQLRELYVNICRKPYQDPFACTLSVLLLEEIDTQITSLLDWFSKTASDLKEPLREKLVRDYPEFMAEVNADFAKRILRDKKLAKNFTNDPDLCERLCQRYENNLQVSKLLIAKKLYAKQPKTSDTHKTKIARLNKPVSKEQALIEYLTDPNIPVATRRANSKAVDKAEIPWARMNLKQRASLLKLNPSLKKAFARPNRPIRALHWLNNNVLYFFGVESITTTHGTTLAKIDQAIAQRDFSLTADEIEVLKNEVAGSEAGIKAYLTRAINVQKDTANTEEEQKELAGKILLAEDLALLSSEVVDGVVVKNKEGVTKDVPVKKTKIKLKLSEEDSVELNENLLNKLADRSAKTRAMLFGKRKPTAKSTLSRRLVKDLVSRNEKEREEIFNVAEENRVRESKEIQKNVEQGRLANSESPEQVAIRKRIRKLVTLMRVSEKNSPKQKIQEGFEWLARSSEADLSFAAKCVTIDEFYKMLLRGNPEFSKRMAASKEFRNHLKLMSVEQLINLAYGGHLTVDAKLLQCVLDILSRRLLAFKAMSQAINSLSFSGLSQKPEAIILHLQLNYIIRQMRKNPESDFKSTCEAIGLDRNEIYEVLARMINYGFGAEVVNFLSVLGSKDPVKFKQLLDNETLVQKLFENLASMKQPDIALVLLTLPQFQETFRQLYLKDTKNIYAQFFLLFKYEVSEGKIKLVIPKEGDYVKVEILPPLYLPILKAGFEYGQKINSGLYQAFQELNKDVIDAMVGVLRREVPAMPEPVIYSGSTPFELLNALRDKTGKTFAEQRQAKTSPVDRAETTHTNGFVY